MKTIAILFAGLTVGGLLAAGTTRAGKGDFRRTRWGMSKEEVRSGETAADLFGETEDLLFFRGEIAGVKTGIIYLFEDGKLVRGVYAIEVADQEKVIEDYRAVLSFLIGLHGDGYAREMNTGEIETAGDLDTDDPALLRELVLTGAADPVTTWNTDRSSIHLRLTEKDGRAAIEVHYLSN